MKINFKQNIFLVTLLTLVLSCAFPIISYSQTGDVPPAGSQEIGMYCPNLTTDLQYRRPRMTDSTTKGQVTELQKFLESYFDDYPEQSVTGSFGPTTHLFVKRFQKENNLLPAVGYVGPKMRAKIAQVCSGVVQNTTQTSSQSQNVTKPSDEKNISVQKTSGARTELDSDQGEAEKRVNCPAYVSLICGPNEEHWGKLVNGCPVDSCKQRDAWCVDPEKSTKHRRIACPAGQTGGIYQSSAAMCSTGGSVSWGEWSQYKNTCSSSTVLSCAAGPKSYPNGSIVSMYTIFSDIFKSIDGTEAADKFMPGGAPRYKCVERDWVCSQNCEAETPLTLPFYL